MNNITKTLDYFNKNQFEQELKELKKNYYVTGYTIETQKNKAVVRLVKKEIYKNEEIHTS